MMRDPKDGGIAAITIRHRWWVLVLWIAVVVALAPLASGIEKKLDVSARVDGRRRPLRSDPARIPSRSCLFN